MNYEELYLNKKNLIIEEDRPVMLKGVYRKIVIRKISDPFN